MKVYEVTLTVAEHLVDDYEKYMLEQHIPEVLATGAFLSAEMRRAKNKYRITYYAEDRGLLGRYLVNDADRLRSDFAEHFPEGVEATRQVWDVILNLHRAV